MLVVFYINQEQVKVAKHVFGAGDKVDDGGTLKIKTSEMKESFGKLNTFIQEKGADTDEGMAAQSIANRLIDVAADNKIDLLSPVKKETAAEKIVESIIEEKNAVIAKKPVDK